MKRGTGAGAEYAEDARFRARSITVSNVKLSAQAGSAAARKTDAVKAAILKDMLEVPWKIGAGARRQSE